MNEVKRLRRPSAGGYARGDETRLRIIEAAIELFGEYGFDGASTRDIAARAGVNAPALQYYFENKEGVLRACAEYIADDAWAAFEPAVTHAREVLRNHGDIPALIEAFLGILGTIADRMFLKASSERGHRLFFAREQAGHEPSIATDILTTRVRRPLNEVGAELIARITGKAPDDPVTLIRLLSLHGQLAVFHIAQRASFSLLGWKELDASKGEMIKHTLREQTRTLLEQWNLERVAQEKANGPSR
jgi:TetR/AcrR family transcriptional regulator, regulator of cefoperazone and chloramphenicol sensitivity